MSKKEFKVGDRVEFVKDYETFGIKVGAMARVVATDYSDNAPIIDVSIEGRTLTCGAFAWRLKLVESAEAVEAETQPQPVTFRICVNGSIGTTEYATEEAAKEAALLHGAAGEEFSIFEVCKVSSFRVSKVLEAV
ncbi:hypothetical protein [Burkholderia vietnamiensis]|uniref:hypothetical protein n=1 Tax=Burkholderia vietnamiensis TaxID=60552 RepID=UPI002652E78E|nr:hypothetical protein [Burkholderia vietnamiensis]MDN8037435.1 hypothetical protein [Burkholderia vietnamiensis]